MRLCVPLPCFFREDAYEEAIGQIAALGYDSCEIYRWESLPLADFKAALDRHGVRLLSMCTSEFRLTDPAFCDAYLDGLRRTLDAAKTLGVSMLITQVGADTGAPREQQHAAIVETLRLASPLLRAAGVTLMIEPLNILVDHPGYYLTTAAEGFALVDEIGSPFVKLVFDIYHQQITEGNILPNLLGNLDKVAHIHGAGHPGRIEMWEGETDYGFVFRALDRAGYTGACGLEYHPTLPPLESLKKAKEIYG